MNYLWRKKVEKETALFGNIRNSEDEGLYGPTPKAVAPPTQLSAQENQALMQDLRARINKVWPRRANFSSDIEKMMNALETRYYWMDIWAVSERYKLTAAVNTFTTIWLGLAVRNALKLQQAILANINIMAPSLIGATAFSITLQDAFVLNPMIFRPHDSHRAEVLKSIGLTFITGYIYPLFVTHFSAIYFAARSFSFPIPDDLVVSSESRGYLVKDILRPLFRKRRSGYIGLLVINLVGAGILSSFECVQIEKMYDDVVRKAMEDQAAGIPPPTGNVPYAINKHSAQNFAELFADLKHFWRELRKRFGLISQEELITEEMRRTAEEEFAASSEEGGGGGGNQVGASN